MNENDFDDGLQQVAVCVYGEDCQRETRKLGLPDGEEAIYNAIKKARNAGNLKRKVYVERTSCQGWCQYAPVCTVWPQGRVYRDIRPEEAPDFVAKTLVQKSPALDHKLLWDFSKSRKENLVALGKQE